MRDGVDPAFRVRCSAEWRSVVEPAAKVPVAVPCLALERGPESGCVRSPFFGAVHFRTFLGDRRKRRECRVEEPSEPDALALTVFADTVQSVIPVAGADQRKAMSAKR